ncbi:hypothetical protein BABINDRAFT_36737 [Babjeviella inositovora NRRL Y-12698]|uniref:UBC core domain-containing protein n=1 Tax=Babjeviella inositovora NRRL Y-12698 TaxID=984486 RepID=A0A1E3QQJ5_9ASCO|nr:uncharacterized protein BABINDRAFT_36737 [Babjeviella inositovora NRRL Y-12698]ODQ79966.1 hypothetical protein BABINDRAFT_36737 [Babjeviella inositovora NRRL Y-12698]
MNSLKRLMKEYKSVQDHQSANTLPPNIVDLQPSKPSPDAEVDMHHWDCTISGPEDSPYEGGTWVLKIDVPPTYPTQPPKISFVTQIIHPNINFETGEICLSLLDASAKDGGWSPAWNLLNAAMAIVLLLTDPEPDSPLNIDAANLYRLDKRAYDSLINYYVHKLAGGVGSQS